MRSDEIEAKFIARVSLVSPYDFRRVPLDTVWFSGTKDASRNSRTVLRIDCLSHGRLRTTTCEL